MSEILSLMNAIKKKKSLGQLVLKISHIRMNLKDIKMLLKPIRDIHRLSDLNLDIKIKDNNNLNMLKSFNHLASLSQLSVNLSENTIKYEGAKKLLRSLARHTHLTQLKVNLSDNIITTPGAKVILLSLARLTSLAHLYINLNGNKVGATGA